jgi:hypothetical protein
MGIVSQEITRQVRADDRDRSSTDVDHDAVHSDGRAHSGSAPIAVSIKEFCRLTSLGRTSAFKLASEGRIEVRRVSGRTLVLMRSIESLLDLRRGNVRR